MVKTEPFYISANGVYRCVKYLRNVTFYDDENGWTNEAPAMRGQYSYKAIRKYLIDNHVPLFYSKLSNCEMYNGSYLWQHFFLEDPYLNERIQKEKISSLNQLQYYAYEKANWK